MQNSTSIRVMRNAIHIDGINELQRALDKLPKELQDKAEKAAVRGGAFLISKSAKSKVSSVTGTLKKAIGISVRKVKGRVTGRVRAKSKEVTVTINGQTRVINPAKYASRVEYGTSRTAARPFIRTAIESTKGAVVSAMAQAYNKNLNKVITKIRSKK